MTNEIASQQKMQSALRSNFVDIAGTRMHYLTQGSGEPILLLHSVPASAWVWRNIIPHLSSLGQCIALDLAGFGKSGHANIGYTLADQCRLVEQFIAKLGLTRLTLVLHGWGALPGFAYCVRHPERCRGLVFYETWIRPVQGDFLSLPYSEHIQFWQAEKNLKIAETNGVQFVDKMLAQTAMQRLDENLLAHYCAPFLQTGSGKPLYQYLTEAPNGDGTRAADKLIADYAEKLKDLAMPKLMLYNLPGFVTTMATVMWAKENIANLEVAEIGEGLHFAQENSPALMGETISVWLQGVEQS